MAQVAITGLRRYGVAASAFLFLSGMRSHSSGSGCSRVYLMGVVQDHSGVIARPATRQILCRRSEDARPACLSTRSAWFSAVGHHGAAFWVANTSLLWVCEYLARLTVLPSSRDRAHGRPPSFLFSAFTHVPHTNKRDGAGVWRADRHPVVVGSF